MPYKDEFELIAYPDIGFYEGVEEENFPLLAMFSNEPSKSKYSEENIAPTYQPLYNEEFTDYSNDMEDYTLYNHIVHFRLDFKLTKNVEKDEELVWCYGNGYERQGYEPNTKCTEINKKKDVDTINRPSEDAVSYALLAYGLDLTDRIENFGLLVSLQTMKVDYYKRSNLNYKKKRKSYVQLQQESKRETFMKGGDKKEGKLSKEYDENTTINTLQPKKKQKKRRGKPSQAKAKQMKLIPYLQHQLQHCKMQRML